MSQNFSSQLKDSGSLERDQAVKNDDPSSNQKNEFNMHSLDFID